MFGRWQQFILRLSGGLLAAAMVVDCVLLPVQASPPASGNGYSALSSAAYEVAPATFVRTATVDVSVLLTPKLSKLVGTTTAMLAADACPEARAAVSSLLPGRSQLHPGHSLVAQHVRLQI